MKDTFLASNEEARENLAQAFKDNAGWGKAFVTSNGFVYSPDAGNTAHQMKEMNRVELLEVDRAEFLAFQGEGKKEKPAAPELPDTEEFKAGIQTLRDRKVNHLKIKAIKTQEQLDAALAESTPKE